MTHDAPDIIDRLIAREGGYVHHPNDRGGATKYGITIDTLRWWRNRDVTPQDVAALTVNEAHDIYRARYLVNPGFDRIRDTALSELCFDTAVHHGIKRAVCWLQAALGVQADGVIGPKTLAALEAADVDQIHDRVLAQRIRFIGEILSRDPSQSVFARGWLKRIAEFV